MKVDYAKKISSLEKELQNLKDLQSIGNLIIEELTKVGIKVTDVRTFVGSATIELQKPWIGWEECTEFKQDYKAILATLSAVKESSYKILREDSELIFGYEFMEKIGINFTREQIKDFVEEKQGKRPSDLAIDLNIGTSHRISFPHIRAVSIQIGGYRHNVGETEFGVKKYENKMKKAVDKSKTAATTY